MFLYFCTNYYSTLTTDESQDTGHFLTQNLFQNVHTVREEEATWGGRLPCALLQSIPSGIFTKIPNSHIYIFIINLYVEEFDIETVYG